jgi:hypothetical protein
MSTSKLMMNKKTESPTPLITSSLALKALVCELALPTKPCECPIKRCQAWSSLSPQDWPNSSMELMANLQDPSIADPTFEEFHPSGTRYDSSDAPIAVEFFPVNRSQLFACKQCDRLALKYTEFGGYYVDVRARILKPELIANFEDEPNP